MITDTISVPELLWTVWCGAGLTFLLYLLAGALSEWRWLIYNKINSMREYAAINSVIIFMSMSLTQLVFVIIGIVAMITPPSHPTNVSPLTYVIAGLFMFASAGKTLFAIIIMMRKKNLVEKIESGEWVYVQKVPKEI